MGSIDNTYLLSLFLLYDRLHEQLCRHEVLHERIFADLSPEKRQEEWMKTFKPKILGKFLQRHPKSPEGNAVYYTKS